MLQKLAFFCLALVCCSCAAGAGGNAPRPEALDGLTFKLATIDGAAYSGTMPAPEIRFSGSTRISGKICNSFSGPAVLADGVLKAPSLASTMMLCPDAGLNALENEFHAMLREGAHLALDGDRLAVSGSNRVLVFTKIR